MASYSTSASTSRSSRAGAGFDRDMQEFLLNVEVSAKQIIRKDTQKRLAEAKRRQQQQIQRTSAAGRRSNNNDSDPSSPSSSSRKRRLPTSSFNQQAAATFLIQPETLGHPSMKGSNKPVDFTNVGPMKFTRADMATSVSKMEKGGTGQKMFISTPYAQAGEQLDSMAVTSKPVWIQASSSSNDSSSSIIAQTSSLALAPSTTATNGNLLPPLVNNYKTSASGSSSSSTMSRSAAIRQKLQEVMAASVEKIAPVLFANPLYKARNNPSEGGKKKKRERQIQSDNFKVNLNNRDRSKSSAIKPRKEMITEPQGPMSWTSDDLRLKYRSEMNRESAWIASKAAQLAAEKLRETEGIIMPVPVIERHPVLVWYHSLVKGELRFALERARARNKMKRFVSDVHTVWVTNLQALREHSFNAEEKTVPRGHALDNRRDVSGIIGLSSQIQSVAKDRAIRSALFSTHEPPKEVPSPVQSLSRLPPTLDPLPTPPPRVWSLVDNEPVYIKSTRRHYRCFIARFGDGPDRIIAAAASGDASSSSSSLLLAKKIKLQDPLWRLQLYDVADGTKTSLIIPEAVAIQALKKHVLYMSTTPTTSSGEEEVEEQSGIVEPNKEALVHQQAVRIPIIIMATPPPAAASLPAIEGVPIEGQVVIEGEATAAAAAVSSPVVISEPLPLTTKTISSLLSLSIHAGPHESIIIQIVAFPYRPTAANGSGGNGCLSLNITSAEAKARLGWKEAPVADLEWWRASKTQTAIWRQLVAMLRFQTTTVVQKDQDERLVKVAVPTALDFDDGGMIEKEGFDLYGMSALALGIIPLLRLSPQAVSSSTTTSSSSSRGATTQHSKQGAKRGSYISGDAPTVSYSMSILEMTTNNSAGGLMQGQGREEEKWMWEDRADFSMPLTLRVSGLLEGLCYVPGTTVWGRQGLWYPHPIFPPSPVKEHTQALAHFFRDHTVSSTDSVIVVLSLSLDTPVMTPLSIAWEPRGYIPPSPPEEEVDGLVPPLIVEPVAHLRTPVTSLVDFKQAGTITIMSAAPVEADYSPIDKAQQLRQGLHHRFTPTFNPDGFRQVETFPLLRPKISLSTFVFGITTNAATPSPVRTTGRFIWHSEQRAVEEIVRRRTPKDFVYISKKKHSAGSSNPKVFTVFTRHGRFFRLAHGGLKELAKEYEKVARKEEAAKKKEALRLRQLASQQRIKEESKARELLDLQHQSKELANQLGGGNDKLRHHHQVHHQRSSLERWMKRLEHSQLLATRGKWEKRRHVTSGNVFWFKIPPPTASDIISVKSFAYDPPTADWVEAELAPAKGQDLPPFLPSADDEDGDDDTSIASSAIIAVSGCDGTALPIPPSGSGGGLSTNSYSIISTSSASAAAGGGGSSPSKDKMEKELGKRQVKKLEDILEGLSTNEHLIGKIADRMGAHAFVPLLKRDPTVDPLHRDLEEDDRAWSDSEDEVGDDEYEPGFLPPQDWAGMYQEQQKDKKLLAPEVIQSKPQQRPGVVPVLPIKDRLPPMTNDLEVHAAGQGWRRLPRAQINAGFVKTVLGRRTEGPRSSEMNQPCKPRLIGGQEPGDAVVLLKTEWKAPIQKMESRFIANAVAEMEASIVAIQNRYDREGKLSNGGAMGQQLLAANQAGLELGADFLDTAAGLASSALVPSKAKAAKAEELEQADRVYKAEQSAVNAVKAGNFDRLEAAVDAEMININVADDFGNSLLILAAQQGSKKMVKFLLRRGANVNLQNIAGNTVLHYAYAYNHDELGRYLESKGANSGLLNAAGLTCYEGLNREDLEEL